MFRVRFVLHCVGLFLLSTLFGLKVSRSGGEPGLYAFFTTWMWTLMLVFFCFVSGCIVYPKAWRLFTFFGLSVTHGVCWMVRLVVLGRANPYVCTGVRSVLRGGAEQQPAAGGNDAQLWFWRSVYRGGWVCYNLLCDIPYVAASGKTDPRFPAAGCADVHWPVPRCDSQRGEQPIPAPCSVEARNARNLLVLHAAGVHRYLCRDK